MWIPLNLDVCLPQRGRRHKTFSRIAHWGKTSVGWFFGLKLHLVINHLGEIVSFCLSRGNTSDLQPLEQLFKDLTGLGAGDKGYLSCKKEETLCQRGLRFISKVRRNMKDRVLSPFEKFFLDQRGLIETVIDQLKAICHIQHTRHRKPDNFVINLLSGLVAYMLKPRKPSLKFNRLPKNFELLMSN